MHPVIKPLPYTLISTGPLSPLHYRIAPCRLDELHLMNNDLVGLPPTLGLLPLRALTLEGNMIKTIRRPILDRGTAAVLAYLKERLPA